MWKRSRSARSAKLTTRLHVRCDWIRHLLHSVECRFIGSRTELEAHQALEIAGDQAEVRPSDLCHLNRIGDLLARAGRIEPGIALFERVARAYAEDGFWAKAIAIYHKILRYDPTRADIESHLACLYQRSGLPIRS